MVNITSNNAPTQALLSSCYFAPVQWYQKLLRYDKVWVDVDEHFVKQTYRNRCIIATTNGPLSLSIPIEKFANTKCAMKDVRISNHGNWRHVHWNALVSAYNDSPFFEYYADDIRPFFEQETKYLVDFNEQITQKMCELLAIEVSPVRTEGYQMPDNDHKVNGIPMVSHLPIHDFREIIQPKNPLPDATFTAQSYYQVFAPKHGFLPNLSILDLLFNMGNEAIFYLLSDEKII